MPEFLTEWGKETPVKVSKKQVFYMCAFRLPEALKEKTPYSELAGVEADLLMGLYSEPMPGDILTYRGADWRVVCRHFHPTRRGSKEPKIIGRVILDFIGQSNDSF